MMTQLSELEETAMEKGIHIHYDRLEAAGLKLKGGMCKVRGQYHLFVDRRKSDADKIEILKNCLDETLTKGISPADE